MQRDIAEQTIKPNYAGRIAAEMREICAEARRRGDQLTWLNLTEWFELQYPRLADTVTCTDLAHLCPISLVGHPWRVEERLRDKAAAEAAKLRLERPRFQWLMERPRGVA